MEAPSGLTWLAEAPMIQLVDWNDARKPYPLSWEEQRILLALLPGYLADMVLFTLNTGCRQEEVCGLRWEYEVPVPELNTSVFVIPGFDSVTGASVKNGEDRVVALNSVARSIIAGRRGKHDTYVFTYRGHRIDRMRTSKWRDAVQKVSFPVRVHDLKHTYGRRLRAAGVPLETRKALLGHKTGDITTHYSAVELGELVKASELVANGAGQAGPTLTLLRSRRA